VSKRMQPSQCPRRRHHRPGVRCRTCGTLMPTGHGRPLKKSPKLNWRDAPLYSLRDVSILLDVTYETVWRMSYDGQLPVVLVGKQRMVDPQVLHTFIEKRKSGGA